MTSHDTNLLSWRAYVPVFPARRRVAVSSIRNTEQKASEVVTCRLQNERERGPCPRFEGETCVPFGGCPRSITDAPGSGNRIGTRHPMPNAGCRERGSLRSSSTTESVRRLAWDQAVQVTSRRWNSLACCCQSGSEPRGCLLRTSRVKRRATGGVGRCLRQMLATWPYPSRSAARAAGWRACR